jgi:hypothetical protein
VSSGRRRLGRDLAEVFGAMDPDMFAVVMRTIDSLVHQMPFVMCFDGHKLSGSYGAGPDSADIARRYRLQLCEELDARGVPELRPHDRPADQPLQ